MKIPEPVHTIANLIDQYHSDKQGKPRPHLGASLLGHHCDRYLWISFRWVVTEKFEGRLLRLFRRGHNEEDMIIKDLRSIGIDIRASQRRVDFGAHVSGSLDGVIEKGVPEAPKARHVAEFKTHSKKSFDDLLKHGVEKSKPQHFIQMQCYMHGTEIRRALYYAVCKDDDRIYTERVEYNKEVALKYIERGRRITLSDRMPEPCPGASPEWYQCKFCPAYQFCWKEEATKNVNCRTCAHATALENSTWRCERHEADDIPVEFQHQGCDDHVIHPDTVPWAMEGSEDGLSATFDIGGRKIVNGPGGYKSSEIIANPAACGSEVVEEVKKLFPDAEVVG
jgi:hypothetical protein